MLQEPARGFNSYDLLKIVALVAMTMDHVGFYYFPHLEGLRIVGRAAAPLFLFLVGFNQSYGFRWGLLLAALVTSIGDGLLASLWWPQSILWTILLGRMVLHWLDAHPQPPFMLILACAVLFFPLLPLIDTSATGLLWMLFGRAMARAPRRYEAALYAGASLVGGAMFTMAYFDWNITQQIAFALIYALVLVALWNFRLVVLDSWQPLRLWSRHALLYYVGHKLLLQGARFV